MYKYILSPLILSLLIINLYGQSSNSPRSYYGVSSNDKRTVFSENFDSNSNNWYVGRSAGKYDYRIEYGHYHNQALGDDNMTIDRSVSLDTDGDYEIETKMKFVTGEKNKSVKIFWGGQSDTKEKVTFSFTATGFYQVNYKPTNNSWKPLLDWVESSLVKPYSWNKLTVRKKGSTMYFFLNESLVHTMNAKPWYTKKIGFHVPERSTIYIDYLKVYQIEQQNNYTNNNNTNNTNYGSNENLDKINIFNDQFDNNSQKWYVGKTDKYDYRIEYGHYYNSSLDDGQKTIDKLINIDQNGDFEIETRMKFIRGESNSRVSIYWGKPSGNWHRMMVSFTATGYYNIEELQDNDKWLTHVDWLKSNFVNGYDYNTIKIKKLDGLYYFYMNGNLIYKMHFKKFEGNYIGFSVPKKSVIHIDYLTVNKLNKKIQNTHIPPQIVITEPVSSRGFTIVSANSTGVETTEKMIKVAGRASGSTGIFEVMINGIEAYLQSDGRFSAKVPLRLGRNEIKVVAKDTKMTSSTETIIVTRKEKSATVSFTQKRLALVIGNSNYTHGGSLANPVNDANSMTKTLKEVGFEVISYTNGSQGSMKRAIDEFGNKLKGYDIGLFFYAGHGLQVNGRNYLVPIDANIQSENDAEYDCIDAGRVLAKMESAETKTNIVILDACRNNPFERSWSRSGGNGSGLAFMNAPSGSLIAYATSPGNTASDGTGANGLYTSSLLKHIKTNGITILEMFQRVRFDVIQGSNSKQTPWESTSLSDNFYFKK